MKGKEEKDNHRRRRGLVLRLRLLRLTGLLSLSRSRCLLCAREVCLRGDRLRDLLLLRLLDRFALLPTSGLCLSMETAADGGGGGGEDSRLGDEPAAAAAARSAGVREFLRCFDVFEPGLRLLLPRRGRGRGEGERRLAELRLGLLLPCFELLVSLETRA